MKSINIRQIAIASITLAVSLVLAGIFYWGYNTFLRKSADSVTGELSDLISSSATISYTNSSGQKLLKSTDTVLVTKLKSGAPLPGDATAPTVSMTSPAAGSTISGTVNLTTDASDNTGVTKVEFYQGATLLNTDLVSPYSYSWDTKSVADGAKALSAKAYDAAGNIGTSSTANITVSNPVAPPADTNIPTVSITSPTAGSAISGSAVISVSASDNVGITKVDIFDNTTYLTYLTKAPYDFAWNLSGVTVGSHTLTAKAYDAAGNVATSAAVTVTVGGSRSSGDNISPTITLTKPVNNSNVRRRSKVLLYAKATDNVKVVKVEFYANGAYVGSDLTSAYSMYWTTPNLVRTNVIQAIAYDAAGNYTYSNVINLKTR